MSDTGNYLGGDELRAIADHCDSLKPLWDAITMRHHSSISIEDCDLDLNLHDADGELVGHIRWGDMGPAFFPARGDA